MQVFVPYVNPFNVACCLDKRRLNKQIIECRQILKSIANPDGPWGHHPIVAMWKGYAFWLSFYMKVLELYRDGDVDRARLLGNECAMLWNKPEFLTRGFCIQHRRRLYTKSPEMYAKFAKYGYSEENWYYIAGCFVKYKNGKLIEKLKALY